MADLPRCGTCGTTEGLHHWVRVNGEGWTCIPCVRASQADPSGSDETRTG